MTCNVFCLFANALQCYLLPSRKKTVLSKYCVDTALLQVATNNSNFNCLFAWLGPAAYEKRCEYEWCLEPDRWCDWDAASRQYQLNESKHSCAKGWMLVEDLWYALFCGE